MTRDMTSHRDMSNNSGVVTLAIVAALAVAFATNPDDKSFRDYVETGLHKQGSSWIERKLVSTVSALAYPRKDYKFFSVVDVTDANVVYIGAFGTWFALQLS